MTGAYSPAMAKIGWLSRSNHLGSNLMKAEEVAKRLKVCCLEKAIF
jgi:hypothetical protein